jgi:hypothetical protein
MKEQARQLRHSGEDLPLASERPVLVSAMFPVCNS